MIVALAVLLYLVRLNPAHAEESHIDYRYNVYQEDNDRIGVTTHSALFDVTLTPKIRLSGELVIDSISGATPVGAPAYKDWNTSGTQFSERYAEQNFGYLRPFFSDAAAWTNYVATSPGPSGQIQQATADYLNSFTNSANFKSPRAPVTTQVDFRESISLSLPVTFGNNLLTPQFSYSEESDYVSTGLALNYARNLNDKNTTLNLGWSHNFDSVRDDFFIWQKKDSDDFFIGVNQLINSKTYFTANFTYGHSSGYLSDPYRIVYAGNALLQQQTGFDDPNGTPILMDADGLRPEKRPSKKDKFIGYVSLVHFFTPLNAGAEMSYRFYHDTYGVNAHTIDFAWHQKIGRKLVISPSFRYYHQNAADFYYYMVPDYNNWPQFYSADYRLSEFESFTYGICLTWRIAKAMSLDFTYSRYEMIGMDGVTADSIYPAANVFGIGARLWF